MLVLVQNFDILRFKMVTFKEDTHQYFNENGIEYQSATGILHSFQPHFDEQTMAKKYAFKHNMTVEEVLKAWHQKRDNACELGTRFHLIMENHIHRIWKGEFSPDTDDRIYDNMKSDFDTLMRLKTRKGDVLHSELLLWHDEARMAGTADLIIDHAGSNEFSVGDFKTNESLSFCNAFGETMLSPFQHLSSCSYSIYSLQLSLYAYMYSQLTGKKCRQLFLMWINRKNDNHIEFFPANYLYNEITQLVRTRIQGIIKNSL